MNFGEKLKTIRLSLELTQDELAARLGTTKQAISRYENSEREPNLRTAREFSERLGVDLSVLADDSLSLDARFRPDHKSRDEKMTTGQRIRASREAASMTQKDLAVQCGVSVQTISSYENDHVNKIPISCLVKIARALSVDPSYLVCWDPIYPDSDLLAAMLLLPESERRLVGLYCDLNPEGQEKLLDYADDLVASGKYIKSDPAGLGQKQA